MTGQQPARPEQPGDRDLTVLEHHARTHNNGLGDPALICAVRRAMTGDQEAIEYCADQLEMMRLAGAAIAYPPPVEDLADALDRERNAHQATILELEAARDAGERYLEQLATCDDDRVAGVAAADAMAAEIADLKERLAVEQIARDGERAERIDLNARLLAMTACAADAARITDDKAALVDAALAWRTADRSDASVSSMASRDAVWTAKAALRAAIDKLASPPTNQSSDATAARVYTPTDADQCMVCGRPEGEHGMRAARGDLACPTEDEARKRDEIDDDVAREKRRHAGQDADETEVVDDPDADDDVIPIPDDPKHWPPEAIAQVLRIAQGGTSSSDLALFALAHLVEEWIAATKEVEGAKQDVERTDRSHVVLLAEYHRVHVNALERQDKLESALVRAVKR